MFLEELLGQGQTPPGIETAPAPPQLPPDVEAFLMARADPLNQSQAPQAPQGMSPEAAEEIVSSGVPDYDRKGMFGIKGTFRDILGTLGDAFLMQGGADPVYRPRRQEEEKANALRSFFEEVGGPGKRLNEAGYASDAFGVYKDLATEQLKKGALEVDRGKLALDRQNAGPLNASREAVTEKNVLGNIRSSLAGINSIEDPGQRALAYQRRKQYIDAYLAKKDPDGRLRAMVMDILPPDYVPGVENLFIDPQQMARLEDYDAERELREQIAEMQEGGRNRRASQAEAGRESRFKRAQETKKKGSKPSFKIPPPPPEFR